MQTITPIHEALRPTKCPITRTPGGLNGFILERSVILDQTFNQQEQRRVRLTIAVIDGELADVPSNFCGASVDSLPDGSPSPYCSVEACEFNPVNNGSGIRREVVVLREDPA